MNETIFITNANERASIYQRFGKRLLDLLIAMPLLILLSPLLAFVALLIRLDSPGEAIFKQERLGKDGRNFVVYKFRTMFVGSPNGAVKQAVSDPRISRIGKFLRLSSLDELPQLWNILKGEMSIVGPRPDRTFRLEEYTEKQKRRLEVKPGITGLAQVNGRNALPWEQRYEFDAEYVDNQSLWSDINILFQTIWVVLAREGIDFEQTPLKTGKKEEAS